MTKTRWVIFSIRDLASTTISRSAKNMGDRSPVPPLQVKVNPYASQKALTCGMKLEKNWGRNNVLPLMCAAYNPNFLSGSENRQVQQCGVWNWTSYYILAPDSYYILAPDSYSSGLRWVLRFKLYNLNISIIISNMDLGLQKADSATVSGTTARQPPTSCAVISPRVSYARPPCL